MVDSPENINREAPRQEMRNKEIDTLNTMLRNGETAESINNALTRDFLENLKNSLHPDTAKQLRDAIKNITWYDQQNNLKQLYAYVVSICDTFDTTGKENDEHEDITDTLTMNDVLNQRNKDQYIYRINIVECISAVAQDNSIPDNFLSAIKGVLNWEKISWGFLVKIAEFLGIDTKRDNRYESRRIKNLWEKVFSMTDEKWLFAKLWKMYDHMDTNTNVVNFRNNPFEGRSLNDICNLLKINWNWDDINKTDPKVTLFCKSLKLNSETFAQQFSAKNLERKNTNTETLNNLSILSLLDQNKAITKTETEWTYKYGDVEFTQANFLTQLGITPNTIKTNLEGAWAVFAWSELENAISSKQNERFNKIVENAGEAPEALPDHITADDIKETKMRWKTRVKAEDVVNEINTAIDWISTIEDENQKTEIINKITNVISALKNPWEKEQDWSQPNITALQETMKNAGQSLIVDWKFGPNTFNAMKNYIKVWSQEPVDPAEPNDPNAALQNETVNPIENAIQELQSELKNNEFKGKTRIQDNILNKTWSERECNVRTLQLHLLPEYKWKIDWKFGPNTLKALKKYMNNDKYKNQDDSAQDIWNLLTKNDIDDLSQKCVSIYNWAETFTAYFHNWTEISYRCNTVHHQMEFTINWNVYQFAWNHFYKDWSPSNDIPNLLNVNATFLKIIYEKHRLVPDWWTKQQYTRDPNSLNQGTTVYKINNLSKLINANEFPVHSCVEYNNIRFHSNNRCYNFTNWQEKMWYRSKNGNNVTIKYDDNSTQRL